jgi:cyclophilin family peptidyl-prolyl cis-trans isomerase
MRAFRLFSSAGIILALLCSGAAAQTLRFQTNVGSFDMRLNPTNDANLQPLVDNLVAYVGLGRYSHTAINRAVEGGAGTADDFVLQMGSLLAFPTDPDLWAPLHTGIQPLTPVTVDANGDGQVDFTARSNTRGTVSLALQQGNPNSGTSSFFINLGDNSSILDSQGFVPFASIPNMQPINQIMRLMQRDLSDEVGQSGSLTYTDVPLTDDGFIVVLEKVTVVTAPADFSFVGPIASALQLQQRNASPSASLSSSSANLEAIDPIADALAETLDKPSETAMPSQVALQPAAASSSAGAVPEPASLGLAGLALAALAARRRRPGLGR